MNRTSGLNHLSPVRVLIALLAAALLASCEAKQGPPGEPGPAGANGANGTDGTNGANGANGANGTNGTNGIDGVDGSVGPQGPAGPQGDAGVAVDKASVIGVVFDSQSGGGVANATVVLQPLGTSLRTNQYGEYRFDDVPIALVRVQVRAPRLALLGNDISTTSQEVTAESEFMPLVAGFTSRINVPVDRLAGVLINIDRFHNATKAATVFKNANCLSCHGDATGQLSRVATIKVFHGIQPHASLGCTTCHSATIDFVDGSNVVVRKPVNAAVVCKLCHRLYPDRFCTATTGTPACP